VAGVLVDVGLQRQGRVEHGIHGGLAVQPRGAFDAAGARRALLQDAAAGPLHEAGEEGVAVHEIGMAQHVGGHQRVFRFGVAVH
jgi:hypothetical protein